MKDTKYKVLLIDDDEAILEAVRIVLEEEGYDTFTRGSLNQALQFISKIKPDLILLDLILSKHYGNKFIKEIKNSVSLNKIPIIVLSAYSELPKLATEAGADDYLSKPFEIEELILKIKNYLKE
jgi:DNA-binding response OmpR family regulator